MDAVSLQEIQVCSPSSGANLDLASLLKPMPEEDDENLASFCQGMTSDEEKTDEVKLHLILLHNLVLELKFIILSLSQIVPHL